CLYDLPGRACPLCIRNAFPVKDGRRVLLCSHSEARKAMRRKTAVLEFQCFHLFYGGLGHFVNFPQYDFFS
ncbi:hypothetical protein LJC40_07455, partial [Synergistaceae bacterium OttesenSCG-928-D05]|nr:hypothetical protein [Synergistaceae bacterium OttesenSCG-928-D05]